MAEVSDESEIDEGETHDCLDNVEFEYFEDEDIAGYCIHCQVCGEEVSAEYEEMYGDDHYDYDEPDWEGE